MGCVGDNIAPLDASTDVGIDQTVDAGPDAVQEAAPDVQADVPSDALDAATIHELYLVANSGGVMSQITSIEVIDLDQGKAVRDNQYTGIVALKYANGSLYVPRGLGQQRISVIDPVTLNVTSTLSLIWDPVDAAFSADGSLVYILRAGGYVDALKLPAGTLAGEVQIPACPTVGGTAQAGAITLNHAENQLAVTNFFNQSCVATVNIAGSTLTVGSNITPPPITNSNCLRQNYRLTFSNDDARVATWDTNCGTIDVYHSADLSRDATASAQYTRPSSSGAGAILYDNMTNVWAVNAQVLYEAPTSGSSTSFTESPYLAQLVSDSPFTTLWLITYDPHNNGIFTINTTSGALTKESWDLSLIPASADVPRAYYVAR